MAWYAGGGGFGGGRVTVAPGREYRIRTRFPLGSVWRLREDRVELAVLRARRRFPDARFDLVRCGIALYGIDTASEAEKAAFLDRVGRRLR